MRQRKRKSQLLPHVLHLNARGMRVQVFSSTKMARSMAQPVQHLRFGFDDVGHYLLQPAAKTTAKTGFNSALAVRTAGTWRQDNLMDAGLLNV